MAALFLWFTAVVQPVPSDAYVLEGPHVLQLTAEAMGTIATLELEQKLLIYPQTPETAPAVYDETTIYAMPERFRSDIVSGTIQRTHLVFGDTSITVIDGRMSVGGDPFDTYQELLRARTRWRLMRTLNRLGVETAICSLGRVDETVVFVLGARYPDESASQLAIDKTTFLPVRLLLVDQKTDETGSRLEIFYRGWKKLQSGWFPMQVQFYLDDRLVREIRVASLRLNPSIPAETMDPEALKASVAASAPETPGEQKQQAVEAVQKGVQDFRKKFE
ncbi:hypothetical protein DSCW_25250 [Desulfosarcina widdelii]|uniref:Uncharacterized protein n=1 Tax=Desulfosarcina widdelii TaxID=947919 RepID=A0A5K7Z2D7_9BACT|nr:hypothetical protein [Desulfosarcina widdelii]BBO75108.1 hypothetical protein DSCW_25250 [Desulfosarcina widdelii]